MWWPVSVFHNSDARFSEEHQIYTKNKLRHSTVVCFRHVVRKPRHASMWAWAASTPENAVLYFPSAALNKKIWCHVFRTNMLEKKKYFKENNSVFHAPIRSQGSSQRDSTLSKLASRLGKSMTKCIILLKELPPKAF